MVSKIFPSLLAIETSRVKNILYKKRVIPYHSLLKTVKIKLVLNFSGANNGHRKN